MNKRNSKEIFLIFILGIIVGLFFQIPLLRPHIVGWLKLYLVNSNDNPIKKFPFLLFNTLV